MLSSSASSTESRLRYALERAKEELGRRRKVITDRFSQFQKDPVGFVVMGLFGFLWSKQKVILESVRDNRYTAVPSCHDAGKSRLAACAAAWWLSAFPAGEAFVVTIAPTGHQVKAILWREIGRIHAEGKLPGYVTQTEWKLEVADHTEIVGYGRSPKDTDPTALQGIHALRVLVIFDEACGIARALVDAAETLVANEFSRMLAIGNPDDPSSAFADMCKPGSGWNVIPISAFETPNFTGEEVPAWLSPLLVSKLWVEERKKKWGENSPLYTAKVLGKFPEQSKDGLIALADIAAAVARSIEPSLADANELGVDVARFGDNFTTVYHRVGSRARRRVRYQGKDTMVTVGHVIDCLRKTGATKVKIDDTGVGGGVTDRLNELKRDGDASDPEIKALLSRVDIVGVNVGEKPTIIVEERDDPDKAPKDRLRFQETEKYFNLRAQLNWAMRIRFRSGDIDLAGEGEPEEDDLLAQAGDIRYRLTSKGYIQIETKDEMTKRGRPSPDDWDALVLAFAELDPTELDMWRKLA